MVHVRSWWRSSTLALLFVACAASASPVERIVRDYFDEGLPHFTGTPPALPPQTGCGYIQWVHVERIDGNRVDVAVAATRPALDVTHYTLIVDGERVTRIVSRERELAVAYVDANEEKRASLLAEDAELANISFLRYLARFAIHRINRGDRAGALLLADEVTRLGAVSLRGRAVAALVRNVLDRTAPNAAPGAGTESGREALELATRAGDAGLAAHATVYLARSVRTVDEDAAIEQLQRALAYEREISEPSVFAQAATQLADLSDRHQQYNVAMRYALEALRHAEEGGDRVALLGARMNLGGSFWQQTDFVTSVEHYEAALVLARELRFTNIEASILGRLAETYPRIGRGNDVVPISERALLMLGCGTDNATDAETRFFLLQQLWLYGAYPGDLHRAEALAIEMLDAAFRSAVQARTSTAFARLADVRYEQRRYDEAFWLVRPLMNVEDGIEVDASSVLIKVLCATGRVAEAEELLRTLVATYESHGVHVINDPRVRWQFFGTRAYLSVQLMGMLVDRGVNAEALELSEGVKARVLEELIARPPAASAAMTAEEQILVRRLEEKVREVNRAFLRGEGDRNARRLARIAQQDHEVRLRARYGEEPPVLPPAAGASYQTPAPVLAYAVGDAETVAFLITPGGDGARRIEATRIAASRKRLRELANAHRRMLQTRDLRHRRLGRELYALLVAPVLRGRVPEALIVIPEDALWTIPFHALAVEDKTLLLDRTTVSYAPSLAVLDSVAARRRTPLGVARVLAVGNELPEAAGEVREIGRVYGARARTLIGAAATEATVKAEAPRYEIVHLATHGTVDEEFPMYSSLLLEGTSEEDGLLEARELAALPLDAELLVLSACETGRGELVAGEGVVGLSWAALAAGARTAVVSQWRVESGATAELMRRFHRRVAAGVAPARALTEAQRELARDPRYAHPFDWAGFIVVGAP